MKITFSTTMAQGRRQRRRTFDQIVAWKGRFASARSECDYQYCSAMLCKLYDRNKYERAMMIQKWYTSP